MAERVAMRAQLSREDSSERGPPVSWDNFSHWVCCVCVVTFDLELGQALEVRTIYVWACVCALGGGDKGRSFCTLHALNVVPFKVSEPCPELPPVV